jgi:ribose transport system ATP-binding protein
MTPPRPQQSAATPDTGPHPAPVSLSLEGITKVYPGAVALRDVSLQVRGGEVVGLIGENGAGKSTLLKVLGGAIAPTAGAIIVDGQRHDSLTPAAAAALGIAFVHQELNAFANLDVAANILIGREITRGRFGALDRPAMARAVRPVIDRIGAHFRPDDPVADLSLADLQMLEICRALSVNARLIVLDEPTSSLSVSESDRLLAVIAQLRASGVAVLFVSHRLSEVQACADRVVVLRDGRNAGDLARGEITHDRMTRAMIGRDLARFRERRPAARGRPVLEIRGVATSAFPTARATLDVHAGEILGLAGLVGAGRTELARAVFGVDPILAGEVRLDGQPLPPGSVADAITRGLVLVPEDRKALGLFLDFGVAANVALPSLRAISTRGRVSRAAEQAMARAAQDALRIKAATLDAPVAELSGGNQQKVVLGKWLAMRPRAIILDEPTRGIDVGSKAEIYRVMHDLARQGVAILMISSDMEEVIGVADRVAVMRRGEIKAVLTGDGITEHGVLSGAVD